jgi:hypothetical protein
MGFTSSAIPGTTRGPFGPGAGFVTAVGFYRELGADRHQRALSERLTKSLLGEEDQDEVFWDPWRRTLKGKVSAEPTLFRARTSTQDAPETTSRIQTPVRPFPNSRLKRSASWLRLPQGQFAVG